MAYGIEFADSIKEQLQGRSACQRALLLKSIEEPLMYEPLTETRNRKVLAIGEKTGSKLFIAGKKARL